MEVVYLLLITIAVICPLAESRTVTMKLMFATCSRALPILPIQIRKTCCSYQVSYFRRMWYKGGKFLTRHLEGLKAWQCAELAGECRQRYHDYSDFTSNVYDFHCNKSLLVDKCTPELRKLSPASSPSTQYDSDSNSTHNANNTLPSEWTVIVQSIDYAALKPDQSSRPCVQIAQLDAPSGGFGEFHEILTPSIPFCRMSWCGYSSPVIRNGISAYNCIPKLNVGNASGCLIAISLMVSVYTVLYSLAMAGFDRCLAVWKPLKYRRDIARKLAVYSTVVIWISAVIFALLPIVMSRLSLRYAISTVLYVVIGKYAQIFYIVLFGVPLFVVWVTNIVVFTIIRRKRRQRRELTNHRGPSARENTNDNRLAVTLMIIVGVFTICFLPAVILLLVFVGDRDKSETFSPHMNQIFNAVDTITGIILMSNSLWNYFIYNGRNEDFRKVSITLLGRIRNLTFSRDRSAKNRGREK